MRRQSRACPTCADSMPRSRPSPPRRGCRRCRARSSGKACRACLALAESVSATDLRRPAPANRQRPNRAGTRVCDRSSCSRRSKKTSCPQWSQWKIFMGPGPGSQREEARLEERLPQRGSGSNGSYDAEQMQGDNSHDWNAQRPENDVSHLHLSLQIRLLRNTSSARTAARRGSIQRSVNGNCRAHIHPVGLRRSLATCRLLVGRAIAALPHCEVLNEQLRVASSRRNSPRSLGMRRVPPSPCTNVAQQKAGQ